MSPTSTSRPSLAEETYVRIRRALIEGTIEPGQRLSEPELAVKFNMSRSPVREALVRLEHEGFIARQPSGRMIVRTLDPGDLQELYIVRASIEGLAARLATPHLRTVDLDAMGKHLEVMDRCVKAGDAEGAIASGQSFHDVIIAECHNEALIEVLAGLRARISRYRSVVASLGSYDRERVAEHRRILKALYERDAQTAEAEVVRHIERSATVLIEKLQSKWQKEQRKAVTSAAERKRL